MTLVINPDLEKKLRMRAAEEGTEPNAMAEALLAAALRWDQMDFEAAVQGIKPGLDAFEGGRFRPFTEFAAEQRERYLLFHQPSRQDGGVHQDSRGSGRTSAMRGKSESAETMVRLCCRAVAAIQRS